VKRLAGAAVLFLAAALPLVAQADVPEGKWWKRPRIAKEIGLSEDQSRRIEDIFVKARPRLIDLKADLEKKQFDLQQSMENNAARGDIEKKVETVEDARKQLQKTRVMMLLDMKGILSADQWEKLRQMREEARERRRGAAREGGAGKKGRFGG
jgi:Spy/CpxP family protein refolding chaperone